MTLVAALATACAPVQPSSPASYPIGSVGPSPTEVAATATTAPTPTDRPTALPTLDLSNLPDASLEDEAATSICDPDANQFDPNAGETIVICYDGLLFGLRVLHTQVPRVDRLYLRRVRCAGTPCTTAELSVVTITGWVGDEAWSTTWDTVQGTVAAPQLDFDAPWPKVMSTDLAPVRRPAIQGAPRSIEERAPYPFCGNRESDPAAGSCFLDAIARGSPAEMLETAAVTRVLLLYRFDGQGHVIRYRPTSSGWVVEGGSVTLTPIPGRWSLDNWRSPKPVR